MLDPEVANTEKPALILTDEERDWLAGGLPINLALQKIIKNHYSERCVTCNRFIGSHTVKAAKKCVREQFEKEQPAEVDDEY